MVVINHHQANPELCSYMGCVGKDDSSQILAEKVPFLIFSRFKATLEAFPLESGFCIFSSNFVIGEGLFVTPELQAKECGVKVCYQQSDKPTGNSFCDPH